MDKHDFKVGDVVDWNGPTGDRDRCIIVEQPVGREILPNDRVWLKSLRSSTEPILHGHVEYLTLISRENQPAPIDQDFDQRMKEKVDTNLRGMFT